MTPSRKDSNSVLYIVVGLLSITSFIIVTTEFAIVGLLPSMAESLNLTLSETGSFITSFALSAALVGPLVSIFASTYDPRRFLITAIALFATINILIVVFPHYYLIVFGRFVQGAILPAILSLLTVFAVGIAGSSRRGWAVAQVNLGVVVTTILGIPGSAMLATQYGWASPFIILGLFGFLIVLVLPLLLPATRIEQSESFKGVTGLLRQTNFIIHLLISFALFTGLFSAYTYISPLLYFLTSSNKESISLMLVGFGVAGIIGNWVAGQVADKHQTFPTVWNALVFSFVMVAVTLISDSSLVALVIAISIWGIAHMAAFVITQVRILKAGLHSKVFALSLNLSACNLGIGFGSALGGAIIDNFGIHVIGYFSAAVTITAALLAAILSRRIYFNRSLKATETQA